MSFQKMYGLRGPWGQMAVLQLTYELRPKWNNNKNNNKTKTLNAVSRSDPLQGSDNKDMYDSSQNILMGLDVKAISWDYVFQL